MQNLRILRVLAVSALAVGAAGAAACERSPTAPDADRPADADVRAAAQAQSSGGVLANQRYTLPFARANPCTGEAMEGTVEWHVVIRETGASGQALEYHMSARVEARGEESGIRYHGTATYNRIVNGGAGTARTLTHHVQGGIISPGPADNWFSTFLVHTTVNAEGELTAFRSEVDQVQCRG